jgi:hypothetical protein
MQNYSPSPFGERGVSPFAYWLGLTLKYFLKTSRKYAEFNLQMQQNSD